ncbi:MAG: hypothetical protein Q8Q12_02860 [bacterium]|nr:hypothetical protein [bacterium]
MKGRKKVSADPAHLYYSGAAVRLLARLVARKHGIRLGEILREVDAAQRMSVDELQAYRDRKFVALARYCYAHVRYYRQLFDKLGLSPRSFRGLEDLSSIPPLTKETLRQRYKDLLSDELTSLKPVSGSTGGTTGEPIIILMDTWTAFVHDACHVRGLAWSGYKMGFPTLVLAGVSVGVEKKRLRDRVNRRFSHMHLFPALQLDPSNSVALAGVCRKKGIRYGMGYPSAWFILCEHLEKAGERLPLQAVYSTAELVYEHWAQKIKQVTGADILDYYGCGEINALGYRPAAGLPHCVPEDHAIIEVVDDNRRISATGTGEFVITELNNKALPLIRYCNGDAGCIGDPDLSTGLPFRRILRLDGRVNEFFYRTDGSKVSGVLATYLLQRTRIPLDEFQLCQDRIGAIVLRHTPSPSLTPDNRKLITRILKSILGDDTEVSFEETADFPLTASGKRRFAICRVNSSCSSRGRG